jgi:hypothetical protein
VEIRSCKYEVRGQENVINLFRDQNKRGKIFVAIGLYCKGNFARERSRAAQTKFHADYAINRIRFGSHRARSKLFDSRRIFDTIVTSSREIFFGSQKFFSFDV